MSKNKLNIMEKRHMGYFEKGLWALLFIIILNMVLTAGSLAFENSQRDIIPFTIRVMFDLKEDNSLIWDGTARVTEGFINELKGIGFDHSDKIYAQSHSWRCILTRKACGPCGEVVTSKGILLNMISPLRATFVLSSKAGNFCVPLSELAFGESIERYNGRLRIELAPSEFLLTGNHTQDDCPSLTKDKSGRIWISWVSHQKGKDRIVAKRYEKGKWSEEMELSNRPGKYYKPAITWDADGGIWVVWPAYQNGNWELYARYYNGSRWSRVMRLTRNPANDIHQKIVTDPFGTIWLCWESYRNGNADIFIKCLTNQWSKEVQITHHAGNDRQPDLAIDNLGNTYIAWTRYSNERYQILLKNLKSTDNTEKIVAFSKKPLSHPSIACAQNKVWIAWDEMKNSPQRKMIESDTKNYFYARRRIGLCCYQNGLIYQPAKEIDENFPFPLKQHAELPELVIDQYERLWVLFHNYVKSLPHSVWRIYGVYHQGDEWSQPILFSHYTWKNLDSVPSCSDDKGNIWIAWSSDSRDIGNSFLSDRDIYAGYISLNHYNGKRPLSLISSGHPAQYSKEGQPVNEKSHIYKTLINSEVYQLVWGSLYQPNNVKGYSGLDGFIADIYRTVMDEACLDFLSVGNFLSYDNEAYTNWLRDKANSLFSEKNQFITLTILDNIQNLLYNQVHDMASEKKSAFIGAFVTDLTSESLQEALSQKRLYIASDNISLDVKILDHPMGKSFETKKRIPKIDVTVIGTDELFQIDIFRNDACIYSKSPGGKSVKFSFLDIKMPKGINYYTVQAIQKDGHIARTLPTELKTK